jgi:murein DD-endopeptidase MepM/ murein hydrolase activator NlpD
MRAIRPAKGCRFLLKRLLIAAVVLAQLTFGAISIRASPPTQEPTVYVIQRGDTIHSIARRYGISIQALVAVNSIADPDLIYAGQRLIIPIKTSVEFLDVPSQVKQGQTLVVRVQTDKPMRLIGFFGGREVRFIGKDGRYRGLIGIHAMAKAGPRLLEILSFDEEGTLTIAAKTIEVVEGEFAVEYIYLPPEVSKLLDPKTVREENERLAKILGIFIPRQMWRSVFSFPLRGMVDVTSPFGIRRSYNGRPARSYHGGIDFRASVGTPVYAANSGRVALAEELKVRGKTVIIDHGLGVMSGYFHLSEIAVVEGKEVKKGDLIGKVGTTGLSTGAHLHWEIKVGGVNVNPLQWTRRITCPLLVEKRMIFSVHKIELLPQRGRRIR